MLWGIPASPPVLRFPIREMRGPGEHPGFGRSWIFRGTGWAPAGLPDAGTGELSRCWAAFQVSSDKPPQKAGAWRKNRKSPNPNKQKEKKRKISGFWFLV